MLEKFKSTEKTLQSHVDESAEELSSLKGESEKEKNQLLDQISILEETRKSELAELRLDSARNAKKLSKKIETLNHQLDKLANNRSKEISELERDYEESRKSLEDLRAHKESEISNLKEMLPELSKSGLVQLQKNIKD